MKKFLYPCFYASDAEKQDMAELHSSFDPDANWAYPSGYGDCVNEWFLPEESEIVAIDAMDGAAI